MTTLDQMAKRYRHCPTWEHFITEWRNHHGVSFGGPLAKAVWDQIQNLRKMAEDEQLYGVSYHEFVEEDGSRKRIDPTKVVIKRKNEK